MLANGIKLGYSTSGSSYTDLPGLQEVPEIGSEPEKVDVTCLADAAKKYELGIGDYGDLEYGSKFQFTAQVSIKVSGGTVNGLMTFKVKMTLNSDIEIVDPVSELAINKEGDEE